jgi:large subunit ribosomal protein L17
MRGRTLGRNATHRKAMFRNMAASFIRTLHAGDDDPNKPKTLGRIITTVEKAKELRPYIEKLVTIARKSLVHEQQAQSYTFGDFGRRVAMLGHHRGDRHSHHKRQHRTSSAH